MTDIAVVEVEQVASDGPGAWKVTITPAKRPPGVSLLERPMAASRDATGRMWPMPDPSMRPAAGDTSSWDRTAEDFRALAGKVTSRTTQTAWPEEAVAFGRHLFDSLLGPEGWRLILDHAGAAPVVVGLRLPAGPLHQFVWELLHDGSDYLTLREPFPAVLVRMAETASAAGPPEIKRLPRVLFAVGTGLEERDVRPGAEVMAVLRGVERDGGTVSARVLAPTSLSRLGAEASRFQPDIVHLIGHGRWDAQAKTGKLSLQAEAGSGSEEHTAAVLAPKLGGPSLVILSACESGVATAEAGAPMAAELVGHGVPIVVAMAGRISDTTCRVFVRAVGAAVAIGVPFISALATGRKAAFAYSKQSPQSVDWALPTLFAAGPIKPDYTLVDPAWATNVRELIDLHEDAEVPVFAGRYDLLREFDLLLVPKGKPGALVLRTTYEHKVGGTRALRELAAEAVRVGRLALRIGPFCEGDTPMTLETLALAIAKRAVVLADRHGIEPPRRCLTLLSGGQIEQPPPLPDLLAITPGDVKTINDRDFIRAVRADLEELRDGVSAARPGILDPAAAPLLLLDDVHLYVDALPRLLPLLGPQGLGDAQTKLPVVLFAKVHAGAGAEVEELRLAKEGAGQIRFHELRHVRDLPEEAYRGAFLSWMLNPTGIQGWPDAVMAPTSSDDDQWVDYFRGLIEDKPFYSSQVHWKTIEFGVKYGYLVKGDDEAIVRAYPIVP